MNVTLTKPTTGKSRIQALDLLRGIAILGILIMNIQSFAMPGSAYLNPTSYGDLTGANLWVWIISHMVADSKFMTVFSILYGAGIILVTSNAESKTGKSAGLHYRRTFWLLVIGLIHAHLIWYGDILVPYALCAFLVYMFRNWKPSTQLVIGILLVFVHTGLYMMIGMSMKNWPDEAAASSLESWAPSAELIAKEIAATTGSISEQIIKNSNSAFFLETFVFGFLFIWRAGGLMLVGMALYKWGVLTAQRSKSFYQKGMLIGWLVGLPIVGYGIWHNFEMNWDVRHSMYQGSQFNYVGSLLVAFGHICAVMLFAKSDRGDKIKARFSAIGQMALSNYIAQSVICVLIFYGIGFGLLGQLDRTMQTLVVLGVWALQFTWSKPWLARYNFGPLEWVWRSLTYLKLQKMKK